MYVSSSSLLRAKTVFSIFLPLLLMKKTSSHKFYIIAQENQRQQKPNCTWINKIQILKFRMHAVACCLHAAACCPSGKYFFFVPIFADFFTHHP